MARVSSFTAQPGPRRFWSILLLAGMITTLSLPACGQTISQLLNQSVQAIQNVNYMGTFMYSSGTEIETMRIVHQTDVSGFKERIHSLSGDESEIIRTEKGVWCYFPDRKEGFFKFRDNQQFYRMPIIREASILQLSKYYAITKNGRERVAGRWTHRLNFRPKDTFRFGLDVWVDEESGLILRSDLINQGGDILDQYMFVDIAIGEQIPPATLVPANLGIDYVWNFSTARNTSSPDTSFPLAVRMIPDGFKKIKHVRSRSVEGEKEQMVFSDDLTTVSLFMQKLSGNETDGIFTGISRLGSVNAYGRVVDGYQVTVLGEVPEKTVRAIGNSVKMRH